METYKMAQLEMRGGFLWFSCTHQEDAEDLLAEMKKRFPWHVETRKDYAYDGHQTHWIISKCQDKHYYALWWMVRQLGERGWEPFAVGGLGDHEKGWPTYLLRKKLQQ